MCFKGSFVFPSKRTIMGLWRTRTLTPDQKAQITEEPQEQDGVHVPMEDTVYLLDVEDDKMSKVYSAQLPLSVCYKFSALVLFSYFSFLIITYLFSLYPMVPVFF